MLTITAVSSASYYLGEGSGCGAGACGSTADYHFDAMKNGEPAGVWMHRGENVLNLVGEIRPEGPSGDAFRALVDELRDPNTGEQLGRPPSTFRTPDERAAAWAKRNPLATPEQVEAYRVRTAKDQRQAVNAWDLTFSAPKSWSVLHAALQWDNRHDDAEELWQALEAGINAALTQAFDDLGFTRHGVAGPKVAGRSTTEFTRVEHFAMALFRHHTSREQDPQLHAHVSLVNRVLCEDGSWRSLYSPALLKNKHQLDATFLRVAEAEATRRLGLSFAARPDGIAREIEGVAPEMREFFSSRTRTLTEKAEEKLHAWELTNGPASTRTRWQIYKDATLDTRDAKPEEAPNREDELVRWEREAQEQTRESFRSVLDEVDASVNRWEPMAVPPVERELVIKQALVDLEKRSTFSRSQLVHALSQRLPDMLAVEPEQTQAFLAELADEAIRSEDVIPGAPAPVVHAPAALRDAKTGRSKFEVAHEERFTTRKHLAREDSLVARLDYLTHRHVPVGSVDAMLTGSKLSDEQAALVRKVASSGNALEVVDAKAGSGKTTTVRELSKVWEQTYGVGAVGFALSQNAADVLKGDGIERTFNVQKFLHYSDRADRGEVTDTERAKFAIPPDALVVVDETSMLDTPNATRLLQRLDDLGVTKVVLLGDREQVDAVDAGGGFAMLVDEIERHERVMESLRREEQRALPPSQQHVDPLMAAWTGQGDWETVPASRVHRLTEVRRFHNTWEGPASSELREGRVEALRQYDARGRVTGDHDLDRVREQVVKAFLTDHLSGRDSVVITGSSDEADVVASNVREQLARAGHVERDGVLVRGTNIAGIGDLVATRVNDSTLGVTNRQVWQVVGRTDVGELEVRPAVGRDDAGEQQWGQPLTLPAWYVQTSTELAYCSTVEAIQGRTLDTSHTLVDRFMGRSRAYPAMTRGREANHAHVVLEGRETPVGRLAEVYATDDHTQAARTHIAVEAERVKNLGVLGPQWESVVRETRASSHRDMLRAILKGSADAVLADPASNRIFPLLRAAELRRHDPGELVQAAMEKGALTGANSPASVLYARLDDQMKVGPLAQPIPTSYEQRVPNRTGEPETSQLRFGRDLAKAMDERAAEIAEQVADEQPEWAVRALGAVPTEPPARRQWVETVSHAAAFREQYGYDNPLDAIGQRPTHLEPEKCWLWDIAAREIGMPEHERDLAAQDAGELANRVQDWQRVEWWLPRFVDTDLRKAHLDRQSLEREVVNARTFGEDHLPAAGELQAANTRIAKLEEIATARERAMERVEPMRVLAEDAQRELDRRDEVDRARNGIPLPTDPDDIEVESEQERELREQQELEDREFAADAAIFDLLSKHRELTDVPSYGSPDWLALEPEDPRREAAVLNAAEAWRRMGDPIDRDVAELQRRLEDAAGVIGVPASSPEIDDDALAVLAWQDGHMRGDAPVYGSPEWGELEADDPRRTDAMVRAAASWWRVGNTPEVLRERAEAAEDRASSIEISQYEHDQRDQARRHQVENERVARIADEQREKTAWLMPTEVTADELGVNGLAGAELAARFDPEVPDTWPAAKEPIEVTDTEREIGRLFLESQGINPDRDEPEVEGETEVGWPEVAPIPEPEVTPQPADVVFDEPELTPGVEIEVVGSDPGPELLPEEEPAEPHREEPAVSGPEPEPEPYLEPEPAPEPAVEQEPEPEVDVEADPEEEKFQQGLAYTLEQARLQREAEAQAEQERQQQEAEQREIEAERQVELDRDEQLQRDLEHARQAEQRLQEMEPVAAPEPEPVYEPQPEPEVDREIGV